MPLWTLDELFDAANHLGLGADVTQKIPERFSIFGGVARGLFSADKHFVSSLTRYFVREIFRMDPLSELRQLVKGGFTHHEMCHYQPQANRRRYDAQIASTFVSRLVLKELAGITFPKKREAWLRLLQGVPIEADIRLHLLEMKVHEQLVRGGAIHISKPDMPLETFTVGKSKKFNFFSHDELSSAMLHTSPYHIAGASNFESVDSFYYDPCAPDTTRQMLLFQMMVSSRFPAKGKGIVALLKAVGWLDMALEDPMKVALIFVCTDDSEETIKCEQLIKWDPAADRESVKVIPGIGDAMVAALGGVDVQTLGDFRCKLSDFGD